MKENGFLEISEEVIRASTPLGAGLGFCKEMCGCLPGAALAIGLRYGRSSTGQSRRPSWSRGAKLVERFRQKYGTVSCAEMTRGFADFSAPSRIRHCMEIIAFATREVATLLFEPDESFADPEKDAYFAKREGR